jgi:hypothetical protein
VLEEADEGCRLNMAARDSCVEACNGLPSFEEFAFCLSVILLISRCCWNEAS